ncbi:MAG: glycosyltransferase family 4 protein, partial [Solirubrobacteraceae bacterium]
MSGRRNEHGAKAALDGTRRGPFAGLLRRAKLTWRYEGPLTTALRIATFPLRATPVRGMLGEERQSDPDLLRARRWYRRHAEPVTVVIASGGDRRALSRTLRSIRRTTRRGLVRIELAPPGTSLQRAYVAVPQALDAVLLDAGLVVARDWLAVLQYAARVGEHVAITVPRVLAADQRIESAGLARKAGRLVRRYESMPKAYGPALIPLPVSAADPACVYLRREALQTIGPNRDITALCHQCWQAGWQVVYAPSAMAHRTHRPAPPAPAQEPAPQKEAAGPARKPTTRELPQIIYVTESTVVGGGHRDVFEHLNRLAARGHNVALYTLDSSPDWFELRVPVRSFSGYDELVGELEPLAAIKVATWWNTAAPVWLAGVRNGIRAYLVQDIETSYYPHHERVRAAVLASYQHEFAYVTISGWNRDRLADLGLSAELVAPGVDLEMFRPRPGVRRREDSLLALGRTLPLKNFPLTLAAWHALGAQRPELRLFGIEPELANEPGISYERGPSDDRVAELFCEASVFVQTSTHEGFCLPVLEAMACGTPVVCTDADGNRDFCVDGVNCLMVAPRADAVAGAIASLLADVELRERLAQAGLETAARYAWESQVDALERFL